MPSKTVPTPDKLNKLERAIVAGEAAAEDARWAQAEEVVRLLAMGMTQREIAAGWINGQTQLPYAHNHVGLWAGVWRRFGSLSYQDRPSWTDAAATVKSGSEGVVTTTDVQREVHEARVPTSETTADRFVENLVKRGDPKVKDTIYQALRAERHGLPVTSRERKERDAAARDSMAPATGEIVGRLGKLEVVLSLEEATSALRDMIEAEGLTDERLGEIHRAHDAFYQELTVANAMLGLEV